MLNVRNLGQIGNARSRIGFRYFLHRLEAREWRDRLGARGCRLRRRTALLSRIPFRQQDFPPAFATVDERNRSRLVRVLKLWVFKRAPASNGS
jgi:hypothetical protein